MAQSGRKAGLSTKLRPDESHASTKWREKAKTGSRLVEYLHGNIKSKQNHFQPEANQQTSTNIFCLIRSVALCWEAFFPWNYCCIWIFFLIMYNQFLAPEQSGTSTRSPGTIVLTKRATHLHTEQTIKKVCLYLLYFNIFLLFMFELPEATTDVISFLPSRTLGH